MGSEELTPEQKTKANMIFKYLKTGKIPKRKQLFKIIFYLSKEIFNYVSITASSSSVTLLRPSKDRMATIRVKSTLNLHNLKIYLNQFITDYEMYYDRSIVSIFNTHNYLTIYYNSGSIKWNLIDETLRKEHSNNIQEDFGFPKIINYYKI